MTTDKTATAEEVIEALEQPLPGYRIAAIVEKIWPDLKQAILDYGKAGKQFTIREFPLD